MQAAVFSIGTELTRGELINSNASWLSDQLTMLGCDVVEHLVVPDDVATIANAIRTLSARAQLVVATGGLGPTSDDMTAAATAVALGVDCVRHEASIARIRGLWEARGQTMPPSNLKQAQLPAGADVFQNEVGSAPAFSVRWEGCRFYFLPGVPAEMKDFFGRVIEPSVRKDVRRCHHQIHFRLFGHPESYVGDLLHDIEARFPETTLGYRAHFPELEVKVLARGSDEHEAHARATAAASEVKGRLSDVIFGGRGDSYAASVGQALERTGKTVAVAESCTGGRVGDMLTRVPGSSAYFLLSAVCYANQAKREVLGVSEELLQQHGAVSGEVAEQMAAGALRISGADLAVSITGIAGPGGGSPEKPVGTVWFGVARKGGPCLSKRYLLRWDRDRVRTMSSYLALQMMVRAAEGKPPF